MPTKKRARIQAYLEPELAEIIRRRAEEEDRPESREVTRLVQLGLAADAQCYVLGGQSFRTKADIQTHIRQVRQATPPGTPISDEVVLGLLSLHPDWEDLTSTGAFVTTAIRHRGPQHTPVSELVLQHPEHGARDLNWTKLLPLLSRTA
jgi:hypothetical protein